MVARSVVPYDEDVRRRTVTTLFQVNVIPDCEPHTTHIPMVAFIVTRLVEDTKSKLGQIPRIASILY